MDLAPIVLFVYNRPEHTRMTLEALAKNFLSDRSKLIVYADGAKQNATPSDHARIAEVRKIVEERQWCKSIELNSSSTNKGLATSVIEGVTRVVNEYGKIIVLEDDLVTSRYFLQFMNEGLDQYRESPNVFSVNGYMFPIDKQDLKSVLLPITNTWGWGTWKSKWEMFSTEMDQKSTLMNNKNLYPKFNLGGLDLISMLNFGNNSWGIKWYYTVFVRQGLGVFPSRTLVLNIGFDSSGTNCGDANPYESSLTNDKIEILRENIINLDYYTAVLSALAIKGDKEVSGRVMNKIKKAWRYIVKERLTFSKKKITRFILQFVNLTVVEDRINEKKVRRCLDSVESDLTSTFYEQATVANLQNNRSKITIGKQTHIRGELVIYPYGGEIKIGDWCYIGHGTRVWSGEKIVIGHHVAIAHNVNIFDFNHETNHMERAKGITDLFQKGHPLEKGNIITAPVIIEDYVAIYANVSILRGVTIGKGSIISTGSIVLGNVPEFSLVMGNPARVVGKVD